MMKKVGLVFLGFLLCSSSLFASVTREYTLGDVDDGFYDGAGSVDDVYISLDLWESIKYECYPTSPWWTETLSDVYGNEIVPFDTGGTDRLVPFSFVFDLAPNEEVIDANLTLRLKGTHSQVATDMLWLESGANQEPHTTHEGMYTFADIGWPSIPTNAFVSRTVNLSDVMGLGAADPYGNRLPYLQDGQFDVLTSDDSMIDYAVLSIEVIPEPCTLALLTLGGLLVTRRVRHKRKGG